jgi:ribonuclease J
MSTLKIISLGGFANVTQNMFVYETGRDILIVDCGVGFPKEEMLGVDLVIPDISCLLGKKQKIRGIVLSHGHEDHIGGLPYVLPQLPKIPVFGPRWALALASSKLAEFQVAATLEEINENKKIILGDFSLEFIKVTHSIPDTLHLVIKTPIGTIYHAADFKLDLRPVMGEATNQGRIVSVGKKGVLCLLSDCLRAEVPGFTPAEAKLEEMFEKEIVTCAGKFLVTTMSSNISRLKQAIDVSLRHGRKVVLVGRSVEQNVEMGRQLSYLNYPANIFLTRKQIKNLAPNTLSLLVAGSQAQAGSALDRLVAGEIEEIKIQSGDKVIFSTDYIPGNETAIYSLIDNIYRLGGEVVYSDIHDNVHVSGHGSQGDLGKLMTMVKPKYLLPIGGNFRHMVAYQRLAVSRGFRKENALLPDGGQIVEFFADGRVGMAKKIATRQVLVDALGVGDVGKVVLRDRKVLAQEGVVIAVLPLDQTSHVLVGELEIVTRGFVYPKENLKLLNQTKDKIHQVIKGTRGKGDYRSIRRQVQEALEQFFFTATGRRPMVLPVIIEV